MHRRKGEKKKKKENLEIKDEDENVPISCHAI